MPFDVYLRKASEDGKVIFPSKFCLTDLEAEHAKGLLNKDVKSLESLKREKDIWEFSGQYMNDPVDSEAVEFKPEWFRHFEMTEDVIQSLKTSRCLMSVDPAFRLKQTNDFSGLVVTKTTADNFVYVLEAEQKKVNANGLIDEIFRLVDIYKPMKVLVETVSAQVLLLDLLQNEMRKRNKFFQIEEVKTSTTETKTMKIRGLVQRYANGQIFHRKGLKELESQLIEFPRGTHDDICFVAGTKIATPNGDINIEDMKTGDRVITPFGLRQVISTGCTGKHETINFMGLEGTAKHPIFVYGEGFLSLDTLTMRMKLSKFSLWEIMRWSYLKLLNSMESNTVLWGRDAIISASRIPMKDARILKDCMWRFGNFIQEKQFQRAFIFIIKTGIHLITVFKTWSVYRLKNILANQKKSISKKINNFLKKFAPWQLNGINQKRAENGIRNMPGTYGQILANLIAHVFLVESYSRHSIPIPSIAGVGVASDIARPMDFYPKKEYVYFAKKNLQSQKEDLFEKPATNPAQKLVYNLTVEKDHCYFANGFLVSNCDSLSMQLPHWKKANGTFEKKDEAPHGSLNWWKKQTGTRRFTRIGSMFRDLVPTGRY